MWGKLRRRMANPVTGWLGRMAEKSLTWGKLRRPAGNLVSTTVDGGGRGPELIQPSVARVPADDSPMTIVEHLEELRTRLIIAVGALALTTAFSFVLLTPIVLKLLIEPAGNVELIYTEVTEGFGTYMRVALFSGLVLAMPIMTYQLILFISPALTDQEKGWLIRALPPICLAFALGAAFGYRVLVPPAVQFLIGFGTDFAKPQIKISNYIDLVTRLIFWIGLVFETPIVIFALAKLHVVTPQRLASYRRYAVVAAFILGAIITPTFDPVNQTFVALPLILLYELGIQLSKLA